MERDIRQLISQMTLEEKAGLCSGQDFWRLKSVERLGIPQVMVSDGPHGLRKQDDKADHLGINDSIVAVCFPAACATASSFDPALVEEMGRTLGEECQAENVSVLLGPAANIKRSPLCGRNFEYFSEDPYLTGKMAAAEIRGVQSWDVGTSLKHYAANNQEFNRMSASSDMSERTLQEIYLPGFEEAVKAAQPKTVMCAYNKLNGVYCSENHHLLTEILRDEWGFEGYVVTDWGAVNDRVQGLAAGLDLEMPSSNGINDKKIVQAVRNGTLDEAVLDVAVERILKVLFSYVDHRHPEARFDRDADHEKAVDIAAQCAVLLQNNGILPLNPHQKVAYIGEYALKPRFQGGGSSHINASKVTSALSSAEAKGRNVTYTQGFSAKRGTLTEAELAEAVQAAKDAEVAVIFAGLPDIIESEGYDRKDMKLPEGENRLIEAVAAVQPNTVVVLHNGSPVETPWAEQVSAILELYLGGQGVGEACDRLLYGEVNPSGHLAESWPYRLEDNPSFLNFPGDGKTVNYAEGIYVGYRYYDKKRLPVRWAFGHGLSYTTFAYTNLRLSQDTMEDGGSVTAFVDITNTGSVPGKAVAQLYVSDKNGTPNRPVKELKGFAKVALNPGETKTVSMTLSPRDLSYYDEYLGDWFAPTGIYELALGSASDNLPLSTALTFTTRKRLPLYVNGATTVGELLADGHTRPLIAGLMSDKQEEAQGEDKLGTEGEMDKAMMFSMPLKSLISFGQMTDVQLSGLMAQLNRALGHEA